MENKVGPYYVPGNINDLLSEIIFKIQSINEDCNYAKAKELLKTYIDKEYKFIKHQDLIDCFHKRINYPEEY